MKPIMLFLYDSLVSLINTKMQYLRTWRCSSLIVGQIRRIVPFSGLPSHLTKISSSMTICHFSKVVGLCRFFGGSDPSAVVETERFFLALLAAFSRKIFWAFLSCKKLCIFNHDSLPNPFGSEVGGWFSVSAKCDLDLLMCLANSTRATPLWFNHRFNSVAISFGVGSFSSASLDSTTTDEDVASEWSFLPELPTQFSSFDCLFVPWSASLCLCCSWATWKSKSRVFLSPSRASNNASLFPSSTLICLEYIFPNSTSKAKCKESQKIRLPLIPRQKGSFSRCHTNNNTIIIFRGHCSFLQADTIA